MEVEKRSSKGGFLQLFDWNLKSRKKLFSNKSELSENLNKGKENVDGAAISRLQEIHEYGRAHYHGASSLSGDERYEAEAPGVVARLMGLDYLPTKSVSKPFNGPYFESETFKDSFYLTGTKDYQNEHHTVMYESMRNKLDGLARNPLELRLQKLQSRPIERFQTEVLPHKSAKPMSFNNNKLLSPIKSPGFIPPRNAAYVMEAAARIIEQSPRSNFKGKSPLRIQDLKEKLEVAQKSSKIPEISSKSKNMEWQPREKKDMYLSRDSQVSKAGPQGMKSKEKTASLAVQAKSNVQKRDVSPGGRRVNQKQNVEIKPSSISTTQPNTRKCIEKGTSSSTSSNVLKQNNQKQNCTSSKDRASSKKPSASHQVERKVVSKSDTTRTNKIVNKIVVNTSGVSGKTNSLENDSRRGFSGSRVKNISGRRRPISVDDHSEKSTANKAWTSKDERTVKSNIAFEGHTKWDSIDMTSGTDVVSFSFSSPIKKSLLRSNSAQAIGKKKNISLITSPGNNDICSKYSTESSTGFNVVGGDALSVLLEQKLKELTSRVDFSHRDSMEVQSMSSSSNSVQDSASTLNSVNTTSVHTKGLKHEMPNDNSNTGCYSDCSSYDEFEPRPTLNWERREGKEEHSSCSNVEYGRDFDLRHLSPASSLERSLSEASFNSLDSSEDSKWYTTSEADDVSDWNSARTQHLDDGELDSACSTLVGAMSGNTTTISIFTDFTRLCDWELEYIRDIINNADLMWDEFACGQVHQIIEPIVFDQFEIQITESNKNLEEPFKVARKALFDCVEECLELKCKRIFSGSFRAWTKWTVLCQSTNQLAEDLYREIVGWTNMVDLMVDEVADKDMSSQLGKWVEFETEIFEEGVEIEKEILSSLLDELVYDVLF